MKCNYCLTTFNPHQQQNEFNTGRVSTNGNIGILKSTHCPECAGLIVTIVWRSPPTANDGQWATVTEEHIYPRAGVRPNAPPEVDPSVAADFNEACLVIGDSPKAAAALGRRCLQHVLREKAGVKPTDLYKEIGEVIDNGLVHTT